MDNKFIQSISITALPENIYFLDIIKDLPNNINYDLSLFISKIDTIKALNDITFNLSANKSELSTISENQINIDIISKSKEDASILRKQIQVENQEIYSLSLIFSFYSFDFNQLIKVISAVRAKFYSKNISSEITNFRHLESYLYNLPLNIKKQNYLNKIHLTTNSLSNIFPFYTTNFIDNNGVIVGYTQNNRMCILNIFSQKYDNANMCIFGCSGSGKSYFTKLFLIKNYFLNRRQIIFDVEEEYQNACKNLGGEILFKESYYNILEITSKDIKKDNYLECKIDSIIKFLSEFINIEDEYLKKKLYELYNKFNINNDVDSILVKEENEKLLLEYKIMPKEKFPTLYDLLYFIEDEKQRQNLLKIIKNELEYFSKTTNLNMDGKLYCFNMKKAIKQPKLISIIFKYILDEYLNSEETIIYLDELWKYSKDERILNIIFNMYKTIRKKNASIITITQDVTDFFEYKNGIYANGILNNSNFKMFFKTNISNQFKDLGLNLGFEIDKLSYLKRGEAIMIVSNNNIKLKIKDNEFEREIINENDFSNK